MREGESCFARPDIVGPRSRKHVVSGSTWTMSRCVAASVSVQLCWGVLGRSDKGDRFGCHELDRGY